MTLRVAFMGTPAFAVPVLEAIAAAGHDVAVVYTRAPAASGSRGLKTRPSPIGALAAARGWAVETPHTLRDPAAAAALGAYGADLAIVVAYGMILPPAVLDVPRLGCLNVHASLLPRWRGAAPIQRAVMAGDRETGIAIMRMEEGLDTGPVGAEERTPIGPGETAGELHDRLATLGAGLLMRALAELEAGRLRFVPQPADGVTYAAKLTNPEARIDWARPAGAVHDQVRGLSPVPGAFFEADLGRGPERVKVLRAEIVSEEHSPVFDDCAAALPSPSWGGVGVGGVPLGGRVQAARPPSGPPLRSGPPSPQGGRLLAEAGTFLDADGTVACGDGALRLLRVQRAGRAATDAAEFLRGARLAPGARLA